MIRYIYNLVPKSKLKQLTKLKLKSRRFKIKVKKQNKQTNKNSCSSNLKAADNNWALNSDISWEQQKEIR